MGGGVFSYLVDLTGELLEEFDIFVAYAVRPQTPENFQSYFDSGVHFIEVKNFTRSLNLVKDIRAFIEIRKIAKKIHPDIIHLHSSKAGVLGRWAFNGRRIPLFYTPHGYSFLMSDQGRTKRMFYKFMERMSSARICQTVACSEGEYIEAARLGRRATYVNNGINLKKMRHILEKIGTVKKSGITVFTMGRICYQKNPEMFQKLAENFPDLHFLWIGDGEMRNTLRADNIEITGWVDRETALTLAKSADIFLLTSRWEGLPISLLEAMYMKKLCLVSDVTGNRDVIEDGKNGFLCRDFKAFKTALIRAREQNLDSLIQQAYQDVLYRFNTGVMKRKYLRLYRRGMKKAGRRW